MNKKIGKYVEEGITAIIGNDLDTARVYLNHASNHENNEKNEYLFTDLLKILSLEDHGLLLGYYHNDERFVGGDDDLSFRTAIYKKLDETSFEKIKLISFHLNEYLKSPDLKTIWKFALLSHLIERWASDNDSDILSELPTFFRDASGLVNDNWEQSVLLFRFITGYFETKGELDFNEYSDYLNGCFYCGISASTAYADNLSEEGVAKWVWAIGANRDSEDRLESFGITDLSYGCGEFMSVARRFAEEVLEVNFEVPDGTSSEDDAYLDDYDWDTVTQLILEDC